MNLGPNISEYKDKTIGYYGGKFLPFHKGHLKCIFEAAKYVDILFVVVNYDNEYDKKLCENTKFEWVEPRVRERWISETLKDFPNIRVLSHYEKRTDNYLTDKDVLKSNEELRERLGGKINFCFSSELSYQEYFEKFQPLSKHLILDNERSIFNISSTKIREDGVYKLWDFLPKSVQKYYTKKVCIAGYESTGKTTLCKKLAQIYNTNWVEEYGRIFYEKLNNCFDVMERKDLLKIACGHNYLIDEAVEQANKVLFIDTDNIYTQYFIYEQYGVYDETLNEIIKANIDEIDFYIYLKPYIGHQLDGMRQDKSEERIKKEEEILQNMYEKLYGKKLFVIDNPNNLDEIIGLINSWLE